MGLGDRWTEMERMWQAEMRETDGEARMAGQGSTMGGKMGRKRRERERDGDLRDKEVRREKGRD